jgi:hypothetical protein
MPDFIEPSDRLYSRLLKDHRVRREYFDPDNQQHRVSLERFLVTGNWGDVQFFIEPPFVTVPEMVLRRFALHSLYAIKANQCEAALDTAS